MMYCVTAVIVILVAVESVNSAVTPAERLFFKNGTAYWMEGNVTTEVTGLADYSKIQGITGNQALHVDPDSSTAIVRRFDDEDCMGNILQCPDKEITYAFWVRVLDWGEGTNAKYIFRAGNHFRNTGLLVNTGASFPQEFVIAFNGNGFTYETFVQRSMIAEWTYIAIVADANNNTMKVYLNGTEVEGETPDSDERSRRATWYQIGGSAVPTYDIDGVKIYYTALTEAQVMNIFEETLYGEEVATTTTTSPVSTTTTTSTSSLPPSTSTSTSSLPPSTITSTSPEKPSTTAQTATTTSTTTATVETPKTTTTTPGTSTCNQVNQKFADALEEWRVLRDGYKDDLNKWREAYYADPCSCL